MIIILVGELASGKTTLAKSLTKAGYKRIVTYTTRPPRKGEVHGKDYYFLSNEEFNDYVDRGIFAETAEYNTAEGLWRYGSSKFSYVTPDDSVIILNPIGVKKILEIDDIKKNRKNLMIAYLDYPEEIRTERALKRGDSPEEITRRIIQDKPIFQDFVNSKEYDYRLKNDAAAANFYLLAKAMKTR